MSGDSVSLAETLGADAFTLKGMEPEALLARIAEVVAGAPAGSAIRPASGDETLRVYSETLIRKLEEKTLQLADANEALGRDLQLRRAIESSLRASQMRFRATFEQAAVGIADVSATGTFLRVNAKLCEITGYSRAELLDRTYIDLTLEEDRARADEVRLGLLSGAPASHPVELRFTRRDGLVVWASVTANLVHTSNDEPSYFVAVITDITERKHAEASLATSESRYRSLFGNMLEGYAYCEAVFEGGRLSDVRIVEANDAFARLTGLRNFAGRLVTEVLPEFPDASPALSELFSRVAQAGGAERLETFVQLLGKWLAVTAYSSDPGSFVVVFDDISARRLAEAQLVESEQRLALATHAGGFGVWDWDVVGGRLIWDAQMYRLYGLSEEEFSGAYAAWREVLHPDDRERADSELTAALEGVRDFHTEFRVCWPTGEVRDIEAHATVQRDAAGAPTRMTGINSDVTERRQADRRIAEQAALIDEASSAFVVRDLEHRAVFWSKGAEVLFGWTAAEAAGQRLDALLQPEEDTFAMAFATVLREGHWAGEINKVTKGGARVTVEMRWTLLRDVLGQPRSVLEVDTDITERKQLEQQFLRAQRMESIGTLTGGIAHDLNNALAPIVMSIEVLRGMFITDEGQALISTLERSAQHGADMVRQLLSFARGFEGERVDVQLRHLVLEVEKIAQDTFLKTIRVQRNVAADLWTVRGDPTQIQQVLMNLCVNARDAMPHGGTLTIIAENVEVDESVADVAPGRYVVLRVEDTGEGMSPEIMDKIFDPFFTTKQVGKGTGLGLSTSLAIVKSHGGAIRFKSEPGIGTTFTAFLPAQPEPAGEGTEAVVRKPFGHGELILVVDDEASIRQITRQALEAFGYRVLVAADGADAVAQFSRRGAEIATVLVDMMMPVMDGAATIRALRTIDPGVRIISVSGLYEHGRAATAQSLGADHFLQKPFTANSLLTTLRLCIDQGAPA